MKVTSAKFTGNPDESGWVQVHDFTPSDPDKQKLRGRLIAVIANIPTTSGTQNLMDATSRGREILTRLQEEYFGKSELAAYDALKIAVDNVTKEFAGGGQVEIAAAAIFDGLVYTALSGNSEVSIFRSDTYAPILRGQSGKSVSASGKPQKDDILILSTGNFFENISDGVIKAAFSAQLPEYATESFAPIIHTVENQGAKGLAVIKFEELVVDAPPEEVIVPMPPIEENTPERKPSRFSGFPTKLIQRRFYIKRSEVELGETKRRKTALTVGILLLVLLVVSIVFGARQRSIKLADTAFQEKLDTAKHKVDEAKVLFTLNPDQARQLFADSKNLLDELAKERPTNEEVKKLSQEFDSGRQAVLGEFDEAPEEYVNLSLIDGFEGSLLSASTDNVKVFDKAKKRIIEVVIDSKKTEVVVGPSKLNQAKSITSYANRIFVLEDEGIFEVDDARTKVLEKKWSGDALIQAYAGNFYVLDKNESNILRYPGTSTGFGSGSRWLAPGISPNLANSVSWTIDGSVWTLDNKGKVSKYTFGSPKDLQELKVTPQMVEPKVIYTNEELSNVYILDPGSSRVIVMDKDGNYKAQYKSSQLKDAIGLAASEKEGKIIFLTKDKLYSIPLNQ